MYIGRGIDSIDNISTLDNLSFNGSDATFNLTQNSVAFVPVSADALQIQIDGVIQANNFTISGSTVTFDFTPNSGSVCNSIKHFGVGLLTQPSTGSVGINELSASGTKDATTFLRGDNTFATVSGTTINNNADNRVITGSGTANTLEGEANLTFDGTTLLAKVSSTGGSGNSDANTLVIEKNSHSGLTILSGNAHEGKVAFADADANNLGAISYDHSADAMFIATNGANRIKVESSGSILIGKTSNDWTANGIQFEKTSGTPEYYFISTRDDSDEHITTRKNNATGSAIKFYYNSTLVGNITHDTSSTSYGTSSDYRLKENEVAISDGIERLKQLKPYRFNFRTNVDKTVDGFFAHEVSSVVPEAISGNKDAVDSEGNIEPQAIDQAKLVPLLTSALQEAITKIETLETENTDIKARLTALENA